MSFEPLPQSWASQEGVQQFNQMPSVHIPLEITLEGYRRPYKKDSRDSLVRLCRFCYANLSKPQNQAHGQKNGALGIIVLLQLFCDKKLLRDLWYSPIFKHSARASGQDRWIAALPTVFVWIVAMYILSNDYPHLSKIVCSATFRLSIDF